jgi:hypothetical protein
MEWPNYRVVVGLRDNGCRRGDYHGEYLRGNKHTLVSSLRLLPRVQPDRAE